MKGNDMKLFFLRLFAVVLLVSITVSAEEAVDRFKVVADRMVDAINKQDYPRVEKDFSGIMLKAFPLKKSVPFFKGVMSKYGKIKKLDPPRFIPPNQAVFPTHFERGILDIKIVLDKDNKITGLWFLPHVPSIPAPKRNSVTLRLPFEGEWLTYWGGDTLKLNYHHNVPSQRFAFDFLIIDQRRKSYKNDGKKNEDYFAFGQKVLAPADGIVTDVIRGVRDNVPGSMNPYSALGNAVFIKHNEYQVSIIAHFKQNSIRVKVGDKVKQGQVLGLCGNSGNSSEAHIHYHLQNTPVIQNGTGIKCFFTDVLIEKDGKSRTEKEYSPIKNDIVGNK